jgi:ABC-type uncharacterized transport system ATPase subunit
MEGIGKSYGGVRANRGITFVVEAGRIVGLLGENGSGKTTLMNILFGMVRPDAGTVTFKGRTLHTRSPRDAIAAGIGMIHQHFMLVPAMTVTENVMLGWGEAGAWLRPGAISTRIREASHAYGLGLDPDALVGDLPLGLQQRVEILKAVLRGADFLILDEPTSNLSPPEVAGLFGILRRLRAEGRSVVFISHKLGEVLELCDEVVVLRDGEVAGACPVAGVRREDLARMMVGRDVPPRLERTAREPGAEVLAVVDLRGRDAAGVERLRGVSFSVRAGEIFAIAGVDGNGQTELADVVGGLGAASGGRLSVDGADLTAGGVAARLTAGVAHIPADRVTTGLVGDMTLAENLALRDYARPPFRRGPWLEARATREAAIERMVRFGVRADGPEAPVRTLSGGNQQKVIVAREIGRHPRLLLAVQPTRGLDPGATRFVVEQILALRDAGAGVLYISTELDEVLTVADRIGVMHGGRLVGVMPREDADLTRLGLMMAGALAEASGASGARA